MLKLLLIVLLLYCVSWWVIYSVYYKFGNDNQNKNYTKDGLYGFIVSIIYFFIFSFLCICVSNFKLGFFTGSKLMGIKESVTGSSISNSMD